MDCNEISAFHLEKTSGNPKRSRVTLIHKPGETNNVN